MTLREIAPILHLDLDRTLALFMGREEMYVKYLKKFPDNAIKLMNGLTQAVEEGSHKGIEEGAHGLKGVSANLGLSTVAELSAALVLDIREQNVDKIPEHYNKLIESCELAILHIGQLE